MAKFILGALGFPYSTDAGAVPNPNQVKVGGIAINLTDQVLFSKDENGVMFSIGSSYDGILTAHFSESNPHNTTKTDIDLGNVENYSISDSVALDSSESYASSKAVKTAFDKAVEVLVSANAYADAVKQEILGDTPAEALDTIKELGVALSDNDNDIITLINQLATKIDADKLSQSFTSNDTTLVASAAALRAGVEYAINQIPPVQKVLSTLIESASFVLSTGFSRYIIKRLGTNNATITIDYAAMVNGCILEVDNVFDTAGTVTIISNDSATRFYTDELTFSSNVVLSGKGQFELLVDKSTNRIYLTHLNN